MSEAGSALMGIGSARGREPRDARRPRWRSPLRCSRPRSTARAACCCPSPAARTSACSRSTRRRSWSSEAAHQDANIIFGAVIDDALGDEVRVTVIAAGFDGGQPTTKRREPPVRIEEKPEGGGTKAKDGMIGGLDKTADDDTTEVPTIPADPGRGGRHRHPELPQEPQLGHNKAFGRRSSRVPPPGGGALESSGSVALGSISVEIFSHGLVRFAFSDRHGGVSAAPYDSFESRRPRRRRPRRGPREPPARRDRTRARPGARALPDAGARRRGRPRPRALARRTAARGGRERHRRPRSRPGHPGRRLHSGPAGRPRGRHRRHRARGTPRHGRRSGARDDRADGLAGRRTRPDHRVHRPGRMRGLL